VSGRALVLMLGLAAGVASAQARKDVPELGLSIPVPKGWTGRTGEKGFALAPVAKPAAGGLVVNRQPAPELPPGTTLPQAFDLLASELTGGAPVEAAGPAEFFAVEGHPAGRQYFRGEVEGEQTELLVGVVTGEPSWTAVVGGWRVMDAAAMRAVADGVMRGLKVKSPPAADPGLSAALAGCWNQVQRSTGGVGSGFREVQVQFGADGRYSRRSVVSVAVQGMGGVSEGTESGRWVLSGDLLQLQPDDGAPTAQKAAVKGGILSLGGDRYVPCGR
jgi:hypothetical protein